MAEAAEVVGHENADARYPGIAWARARVESGEHSVRSLNKLLGLSSTTTLHRLMQASEHPQVSRGTRDRIDAALRLRMEIENNADNRVLIEHLPFAGPEDDPVEWWREMAMQEWGFNLNDIADRVGYDASVVSKVFAGKYEGNMVTVRERFRTARIRELGPSQGCVIQTENARRVWSALDESAGSCYLTVITGEAGIGKTDALQRYARAGKLSGRRMVMITVDQNATTRTICDELLMKLGGTPHGQTTVMVGRIIEELRHESRLLVFDEVNNVARYLRNAGRIVNTIRHINDLTHCGAVLCGTQALKSLVYAPKNYDEMEMLQSRIGLEVELGHPRREEIEAFVKAFFPAISEGALKVFFELLNRGQHHRTPNSFRRAASWVLHMQRILELNSGAEMTQELVRLAWGRMHRVAS